MSELSNIEQNFNGYYTPTTDIKETNEFIIIEIELPGVSSKDICIELGDSTLDVRGETRETREDSANTNNYTYIRKERVKGRFKKSINVTSILSPYDVKAIFKDGLLVIEIPKPKERNNLKKQKINLL